MVETDCPTCYFPNKSVLEASQGYIPSFMWSSIFNAKWIIDEGTYWRVDNGRDIMLNLPGCKIPPHESNFVEENMRVANIINPESS